MTSGQTCATGGGGDQHHFTRLDIGRLVIKSRRGDGDMVVSDQIKDKKTDLIQTDGGRQSAVEQCQVLRLQLRHRVELIRFGALNKKAEKTF